VSAIDWYANAIVLSPLQPSLTDGGSYAHTQAHATTHALERLL
jgi:hypothetical protein